MSSNANQSPTLTNQTDSSNQLLQKQLKSFIVALSREDLERLLQSFEQFLGAAGKIAKEIKNVSYQCYEVRIQFEQTQASGFGRDEKEASGNSIKNFFDSILEDDSAILKVRDCLKQIKNREEDSKTEKSPTNKPSLQQKLQEVKIEKLENQSTFDNCSKDIADNLDRQMSEPAVIENRKPNVTLKPEPKTATLADQNKNIFHSIPELQNEKISCQPATTPQSIPPYMYNTEVQNQANPDKEKQDLRTNNLSIIDNFNTSYMAVQVPDNSFELDYLSRKIGNISVINNNNFINLLKTPINPGNVSNLDLDQMLLNFIEQKNFRSQIKDGTVDPSAFSSKLGIAPTAASHPAKEDVNVRLNFNQQNLQSGNGEVNHPPPKGFDLKDYENQSNNNQIETQTQQMSQRGSGQQECEAHNCVHAEELVREKKKVQHLQKRIQLMMQENKILQTLVLNKQEPVDPLRPSKIQFNNGNTNINNNITNSSNNYQSSKEPERPPTFQLKDNQTEHSQQYTDLNQNLQQLSSKIENELKYSQKSQKQTEMGLQSKLSNRGTYAASNDYQQYNYEYRENKENFQYTNNKNNSISNGTNISRSLRSQSTDYQDLQDQSNATQTQLPVPKLNLEILPNYHGQSSHSLNTVLLQNYENQHGPSSNIEEPELTA